MTQPIVGMVTAIEGKTLHFPLFGRETTPTTVQQRCVLLLQNHEEGTSLSPTCGEQRRPCDFSPRLKGHSTGMCVLAMLPDITNAMMECLVVLINPPKKMWIPHSASNLGTSKKNMKYHGIFFQSSTYWQYVWCQKWSLYYISQVFEVSLFIWLSIETPEPSFTTSKHPKRPPPLKVTFRLPWVGTRTSPDRKERVEKPSTAWESRTRGSKIYQNMVKIGANPREWLW